MLVALGMHLGGFQQCQDFPVAVEAGEQQAASSKKGIESLFGTPCTVNYTVAHVACRQRKYRAVAA